jgi:hypothetical protein
MSEAKVIFSIDPHDSSTTEPHPKINTLPIFLDNTCDLPIIPLLGRIEEIEKFLIPKTFDMVFIDTSHIYPDTYRELELASKITDWMLMDDAKFDGNEGDPQPGGVKRSIEEWGADNKGWNKTDLWHGNVVLFNKIKQPAKKTRRSKK